MVVGWAGVGAVRGTLLVDDICASWDSRRKTNVSEAHILGKLWGALLSKLVSGEVLVGEGQIRR